MRASCLKPTSHFLVMVQIIDRRMLLQGQVRVAFNKNKDVFATRSRHPRILQSTSSPNHSRLLYNIGVLSAILVDRGSRS